MSEFKKGEYVLVDYETNGRYVIRKIESVGDKTAKLIDSYYTTEWDLDKLHKVPKSILKQVGLES